MIGTIVRVRPDRSYGFLRDDAGTEYFFHRTAVLRDEFHTLALGDRVTFDEEASERGPRACHVAPV